MVAGSSANTVIWYTGDADTDPARATATAQVDSSTRVSYGLRASEQGLRSVAQSIAVLAATSYSPADPNAAASYAALTQRVGSALDGVPGQQTIADLKSEITGAQTSIEGAKVRHQQTRAILSDLLANITTVPEEQVGAQILALQTNLQATLQTTALLYKTSLINYI
jgi:hypothetical protein